MGCGWYWPLVYRSILNPKKRHIGLVIEGFAMNAINDWKANYVFDLRSHFGTTDIMITYHTNGDYSIHGATWSGIGYALRIGRAQLEKLGRIVQTELEKGEVHAKAD